MTNRRLITLILIIVLAAAAIVVLNRLPFFTESVETPGGEPTESSVREDFRMQFYDPETGLQNGELVAGSYNRLDDGTIDAQDLSLKREGTSAGDVELTSDRAKVKMSRLEGGLTGTIELSGNVLFKSKRDGRGDLKGSFERVLYDYDRKFIDVTGQFAISSAEGVSVQGTDILGSLRRDTMQFTVKRNILVEITAAEALDALAKDSNGAITVRAGGPLVFDALKKSVRFAGGVTVTSGDTRVQGSMLALEFAGDDDRQEATLAGWKLTSMAMDGPVEAQRSDFTLVGDRLYWQESRAVAGVEGSPALLVSGDNFIKCSLLEVTFTDDGRVAAIAGYGPGSARFLPSPSTAPDEGGQPVNISWASGFFYDASGNSFDVTGDVEIAGPEYTGRAARVRVALEKVDKLQEDENKADKDKALLATVASRITGFAASGGVTFGDGTVQVNADTAIYDYVQDTVTLSGAPVTAVTGEARFSAESMVFERKAGRLIARRNCRVEIDVPVSDKDNENRPQGPIVAAADEIRAVFPAGTFRADCLGNVNVAWGESHLKCTKLSIIGAVTVPDPTVEGVTDDGSVPSGEVVVEGVRRVAGEGDVVFRRGEFLAKCGYFTFDDETGMLELMPDEESEIEIDFGELATMWAERVIVDEKKSSVECVSPQVVLLVDDSFMGFRETGRAPGSSSATRAKIDLSAGGSLTLVHTTAESARLDFTGGVEATRWDSSTTLEDKITCERLELDVVIEPKRPGEDMGRTKVIAARATGGVYLRYLGPKVTLEGRGDRFEWGDKEDIGKLSGSPATVWVDGDGGTSVQNADEFIYYFSDQSIEVRGAGGGTFTIDRTAGR